MTIVLGLGACSEGTQGAEQAWDLGTTATGSMVGTSSLTVAASSESTSDAEVGETGLDSSSGGEPPCIPDDPPPERILFIGNSFTLFHDVSGKFRDLVIDAGFPEPQVVARAVAGYTLAQHRADDGTEGAPARIAEGWDVVVLQEFSTRPTDALGNPMQFKVDATWFYDAAHDAHADTQVYLYETWARHPDHSFYPSTFSDPADMQAQLRFHYLDAAEHYIPANTSSASPGEVRVALVGDAWESIVDMGEPVRIHASDDYHQNAAGAYLCALVLFGTIYDRRTEGLVPIDVSDADAFVLQSAADWITGATIAGPPITCDER